MVDSPIDFTAMAGDIKTIAEREKRKKVYDEICTALKALPGPEDRLGVLLLGLGAQVAEIQKVKAPKRRDRLVLYRNLGINFTAFLTKHLLQSDVTPAL